jgi:hypothetical protein
MPRSHLKNEYRHAELGSASHYFSNLDPEMPLYGIPYSGTSSGSRQRVFEMASNHIENNYSVTIFNSALCKSLDVILIPILPALLDERTVASNLP